MATSHMIFSVSQLLCVTCMGAALALAGPAVAVDVRVPPYGAEGCWVLVFGKKDFYPPVARLQGPTYIEKFENGPVLTPELRDVGGDAFLQQIESAIVGPRANLTGYRDIRFDGPSMALAPNTQVADLNEIQFHERVKSLQVHCE